MLPCAHFMSLHRLILCCALVFFPSRAWPAPPTPPPPSLERVSEQAVDHLTTPLRIDLYYSPKSIPVELRQTGTDVLDILDLYAKAARGKLTWKIIDPYAEPNDDKRREVTEAASKCGVEPMQVQVMKDGKYKLSSLYLGLCLNYGSQSKSLPKITSSTGLEFLITSTIKRVTEKPPTIAFTTGHGELTPEEGLRSLRPDLVADFAITLVNPSRENIGDEVAALVVGGPRQAFDDQGRRELDRFLISGRNAIFLVDGTVLKETNKDKNGQATASILHPNDAGLDPLLAKYGFKVEHVFVADPANAAQGAVFNEGRKALVQAPTFVAVPVKKDQAVSLFDNVRGAIVFPSASPVYLAGPLVTGPGTKGILWNLAETSATSISIPGSFTLSPPFKLSKAQANGPFTLGYAFQGKVTSAYAQAPTESAKPIRLVVIGDSDFISDETTQLARFLPYYAQGAQLFWNTIQWLFEDEALMRIRTKAFRTGIAAPPI